MPLKVAVLTSTFPRHRYFLLTMRQRFDVAAALHQSKAAGPQEQAETPESIRHHFQKLIEGERKEFLPRLGTDADSDLRSVTEINDPQLVSDVSAAGVDIVCLFGTAILKSAWLSAFPRRIVNLHLGLSPFYRGAATLFWPFAEGELECAGTTIHLAAPKVDAGPILKRIKADPKIGDDYYTLTNRLIRRSIDAMPDAIEQFVAGSIIPQHQDLTISKLFRRADFTEAALQRMLSQFGSPLTAEQIVLSENSNKCCW
jgi:methionyl-tRNA formyltransferase